MNSQYGNINYQSNNTICNAENHTTTFEITWFHWLKTKQNDKENDSNTKTTSSVEGGFCVLQVYE